MEKQEKQDEPIEIDDSLLRMLPQMIANLVSVVKFYRSFYELLVKEGFTEEQALQIVIARGMTI